MLQIVTPVTNCYTCYKLLQVSPHIPLTGWGIAEPAQSPSFVIEILDGVGQQENPALSPKENQELALALSQAMSPQRLKLTKAFVSRSMICSVWVSLSGPLSM